MDFNVNRNAQASAPGTSAGGGKKGKFNSNKWVRWGTNLLGGAIIVLIIAVVALISFGGPKAESKYVDSSRLQAVFLNTGQVYFGNIKSLNKEYFVVSNIYYLQTSSTGTTQSNANTNVSLVKLGCELHEPYDQMVINSDQVTFWENLQDNGQVAKAVATFEKQNPDGQKCADQSSSSSSSSSSSTQPAGSNSSSTSNNQ